MVKRLKLKSGFTLVEVTLVLAVSALLISGIMVGTSASIARQRYNDAMYDLVDYFRQAYSEVINVQNVRSGVTSSSFCSVTTVFNNEGSQGSPTVASPGRTDCAIYGKLLTIGELPSLGANQTDKVIHSYDIIGKVYSPDDYKNSQEMANSSSDNSAGISSDKDIETLKEIGANVVTFASTSNNSQCTLSPAGTTSYYRPLWGVELETTAQGNVPFRGAILIFRSPLSGTVQTYYIDYSSRPITDQNVPINVSLGLEQFQPLGGACNVDSLNASNIAKSQATKYLAAILEDPALVVNDTTDPSKDNYITLCAASDDLYQLGTRRRGIRILKGGHNATAVELLNSDVLRDGEENPCR